MFDENKYNRTRDNYLKKKVYKKCIILNTYDEG